MRALETESPTPRPRGRRRDPAIDRLILDAARALLVESGFTATTVQEISRRSGIHPPTIYRRWPSRIALIRDAAFFEMTEINVKPTGDLAADLLKYIKQFERTLASPAARAAIPGLLAAYEPGSHPSPQLWAHVSGRQPFLDILRAAPDQVDPAVDPNQAFDVLTAMLIAGILVPGMAKRSSRTTTDYVVRLLRPHRPATRARR